MQNLKLYCSLLLLTAMLGCAKNEVATPEFDVTVNSATFKAGDPVVFNFSGAPENITFYSGEDFSKYDNRGQATTDKAITKLEFTTATGGGVRANSLKLMYTTDIDEPTVDNVNALNWTDITDRFILATTTAATLSGAVDLADIAALNKPVRFAFKYESISSTTLAHPVWSIRTFNLNAAYSDAANIPITALTTAGWSVLDVKNAAATWTISATQVREDGGAKKTADQEDWVISKPLALNITRDIFDTGYAVKSINDKMIPYTHTFAKAGTYKATFVAFNHSIDGEKSIVKELTITILP